MSIYLCLKGIHRCILQNGKEEGGGREGLRKQFIKVLFPKKKLS